MDLASTLMIYTNKGVFNTKNKPWPALVTEPGHSDMVCVASCRDKKNATRYLLRKRDLLDNKFK